MGQLKIGMGYPRTCMLVQDVPWFIIIMPGNLGQPNKGQGVLWDNIR